MRSLSGADIFLSYLPEFRAKTESSINPLPCSFCVQSLVDFVGNLPEELLLCPVRSLRHISRTASVSPHPLSLFFFGISFRALLLPPLPPLLLLLGSLPLPLLCPFRLFMIIVFGVLRLRGPLHIMLLFLLSMRLLCGRLPLSLIFLSH